MFESLNAVLQSSPRCVFPGFGHQTSAPGQHNTQHHEAALLLNNMLAHIARAKGVNLYKLLPKHHALTHIAYDSYTNPRLAEVWARKHRCIFPPHPPPSPLSLTAMFGLDKPPPEGLPNVI